jgi:RND family efflux transporter MFP subunit
MAMSANQNGRQLSVAAAFSVVTLVGLLPLAAGCNKEAPAAGQAPVPKVTTTPVVEQETTDYDEYTGQTEASESVEVRARVFGYLKSIEFKDGDFVKEGQTLFTIEPDEYEATYNQALSKIKVWESKLDVAKANLARRQKVFATGAITREEYEEYVAGANEAAASLEAAKADAARAAVDLKYTVLKAPISGRIDRAMVSKGTLLTGGVGSGTLLTKIIDEQPMYVYFDVDQQSLLRYKKDRPAPQASAPGSLRQLDIDCYVQLPGEKDFPHKGKLDFVETEVKSSTGTARLRGVFENKNREMASGLSARVKIPTSKPYQALFIPERAIATDQSMKFVYVVGSDGIANRRAIELGPQSGEMRIVTKGLKAGEPVIVKGLQRVRPGQKVEATQEQPKLAAATTAEIPVAKPAPLTAERNTEKAKR